MAMHGSPAESVERLRAAERSIGVGSVTLAIFTLIALAISVASVLSGINFSLSVAINLILGLAISLPRILSARSDLRHALTLIARAQDQLESKPASELDRHGVLPQFIAGGSPEPPGSVTDNTTLELTEENEQRDRS